MFALLITRECSCAGIPSLLECTRPRCRPLPAPVDQSQISIEISIKIWTNQRTVFSIHLPLGCQQPLHTHWAPGVDTSSRDPDLGIEVVLPPLFVLFQIFLNPFEVSQCPEKASSRYNGQLHGFLLTEIPIVIYDLCGQVSPNTYLPLL